MCGVESCRARTLRRRRGARFGAHVFAESRDAVIGILDENFVVESVDTYVYDPESGTVVLDITVPPDGRDCGSSKPSA